MGEAYASSFVLTPPDDVPLVAAETSSDNRREKLLKNITDVNETVHWRSRYMPQLK